MWSACGSANSDRRGLYHCSEEKHDSATRFLVRFLSGCRSNGTGWRSILCDMIALEGLPPPQSCHAVGQLPDPAHSAADMSHPELKVRGG